MSASWGARYKSSAAATACPAHTAVFMTCLLGCAVLHLPCAIRAGLDARSAQSCILTKFAAAAAALRRTGRYVKAFGPGAVVFALGYGQGLQQSGLAPGVSLLHSDELLRALAKAAPEQQRTATLALSQ